MRDSDEDALFRSAVTILRLIESGQRLVAELERLSTVLPTDAALAARSFAASERAVHIREATARGMSIAQIMDQFGVSKSTVERARRGATTRHNE